MFYYYEDVVKKLSGPPEVTTSGSGIMNFFPDFMCMLIQMNYPYIKLHVGSM